MDQATHNKIVSFIWGIADDVLRDLFKRGKYPDVILPMCVLRRFDAVLEPTKQAVLETKSMLDKAGITAQHEALCAAAKEAFYNTSPFTLKDLASRASQQQLKADFEAMQWGGPPGPRLAPWPARSALCRASVKRIPLRDTERFDAASPDYHRGLVGFIPPRTISTSPR